MKQCPVCNRTYFDDSLSYCLNDGTLLADMGGDEQTATFVRPTEDITVLRSHAGTPVPTANSAKAAGSSGGMKALVVALIGVVLLLVVVIVVLGGAFLWNRGRQATTDNLNSNSNQSVLLGASPSPDTYRSTPLPSPTATAMAMTTPLPTPPKDERLTDIPGSGRTFTDPGTSRLQFRRGSVGETFRGTVARQRSFVLRTLSGQYLSAVVRSVGNCVIFREASSEIAFTTSNGDTSLTVVNRCPEPQDFTMSVTVR
ncbi:MAG: hypothetical protein JO314_01250 [Acidobacteria bacterium]|nr:hypothetical protein [Acidobacteriota bacterium]